MAALYQWQIHCLICGEAAEFHCNTCGDLLCSKCKQNHLKSGASKHHNVVPYAERITPNTSGDCKEHPGNQYQAWCQICCKTICNDCIFSAEHRGHTFQKLGDMVNERCKELQKELSKNEAIIKGWTVFLEDVVKKQKQLKHNVRHLEKSISQRTSELVTCIKMIDEMKRNSLRSFYKQTLYSLEYQKQNAVRTIKIFRKRAAHLDDKLRSGDTNNLMATSNFLASSTMTNFPELNFPKCIFFPGILDQVTIVRLYGELCEIVDQPKRKVQVTKRSKLKTEENTTETINSLDLANETSSYSAQNTRERATSKSYAFQRRSQRSASQ